jgi:hypothetical protein
VPFTVRIDESKEDKQLFEKLSAELPGILNWCVAGCREWQRNGLGTAGAILAATNEYRAGQDPVAAFFTECVRFDEPRARVSRKELFAAYESWARAEGDRFPVGTKTFAEAVRDKGAGDSAVHGIRHWVGVRLLTEAERRLEDGPANRSHTDASKAGALGYTDPQSFMDHTPRVEIDGERCTQVHQRILEAHADDGEPYYDGAFDDLLGGAS